MALDVRTFLVLSAAFIGMTGLGLWVVARFFPERYRRSATDWTRASLLFAFGTLLVAAQGHGLEASRIVFGNLAYLVAAALLYQSLRRFDGEQPDMRAYLGVVVPAMLGVLACYYLVDHYSLRVLIMALALALLFSLSFRQLWWGGVGVSHSGIRRMVAGCFALNILVLGVRVSAALATWQAPPPLLDNGWLPTLYVGVSNLALVGLVFSYLVLAGGQMAAQLSEEAHLDALTGLPNRRAFEAQAARLLKQNEEASLPTTLLLLDGDKFKYINDRFGHQVGDAALCAMAQAMQGSLRKGDLIARLGGDEFAILLQGTTLAQAEAVTARIGKALARTPFAYPVSLSVSIGAAQAAATLETLGALVARADRELYRAKALPAVLVTGERRGVLPSAVSPNVTLVNWPCQPTVTP